MRIGKNKWETEFQIDCASPVLLISQKKLFELEIQERYLAVKAVQIDFRNVFYSATNDIIKIIGQVVVRIESEGWFFEGVELFITDGSQRDILGNNLLPSLGIEIRQERVSRGVNDVGRGHKTRVKSRLAPST